MKRKYEYSVGRKKVVREINYIPGRYIVAMMLTVLEVLAIIAIVVLLCMYVPYFYISAYVTQVACVIKIISSDDNPDYKVPWLLFVLIIPIVGFLLYLMFSSRKLKKRYVKRLKEIKSQTYEKDDAEELKLLSEENLSAANQARMITSIAETHVFKGGKIKYFPLGEDLMKTLLEDLKKAEKFIFMEYFIIDEGEFWDSILDILKEKVSSGVEVRVVFDDIGCMTTLPGNYAKILRKQGIKATPFSRLKGSADGEFNNRSHRKITVIDGVIGYTGGINIADEYINKKVRFGHWKDNGIRLEGQAVWELTKLFLIDYGINVKDVTESGEKYFPQTQTADGGYVVPFGDGPAPLYKHAVGKSVIQNMIGGATKYAYMTTPYLIIDNDLCQDIENAAMRGVDVKIIVPHIPDKKLVSSISKSYYNRLIDAGVKIYEYEPGFIHAKTYVVDGEYAMVGTINLDYRSLVHHFENGVWMYGAEVIKDIEKDVLETVDKSILVTERMKKANVFVRFIRSIFRVFSPLL